METQELAWQRYAKQELGYLLCHSPNVTFEKAAAFYYFLDNLLPRNFDWVKHCGDGIDVDSGATSELKLRLYFLEPEDIHVWIKTTEDNSFKFLVRNRTSKTLYKETSKLEYPTLSMELVLKQLIFNANHYEDTSK